MASVSHTDTDSNTANQTTYSFTCTLGAGDGVRTLAFGIVGRMNNASAAGVVNFTVDGVSGGAGGIAIQNSSNESGNIKNSAAILQFPASSLPDPTAASVTLAVTFNGQQLRAGVDTYVIPEAVAATASDTATETSNATTATPYDVNLDMDIPAGGVAIGVVASSWTTSPTPSAAWTGMTEDSNDQPEGAMMRTAAHLSNGSLEVPRTITCRLTDTGGSLVGPVGVAAVWTPAAAPAAARSYGVVMG